ncbi:MAG TPA: hypothetical protein VKV16_09135 [Solirubrobacteraceae bacterium]|nr:hypothetical protein [Solirubrobacteraceae bacterium]
MTRTALIGLLAAVVAAILPAGAAATVTPSLAITQGNGAPAGSTATTKLAVSFANKPGDAPKAMTLTFPPGFLLDLDQNEGKCLASSAPGPSCTLGRLEAKTSSENLAWTMALVAPPTIGDIAGIALQGPAFPGTGVVKLITSPAVELRLELPAFPSTDSEGNDNGGVTEADMTLNSPRLPTACGVPLFFDLSTSTFKGSTASTAAPLELSGCSTLPYAPKVAATVTKVGDEEGADVAITLTQPNPAGESATSSFQFGNPKGVKTNKVLAPCFKGSTCTVGTVVGSSPTLAPSELSTGELTLAGSINSGDISAQVTGAVTMSFPPPFQFAINGPLNVSEHTITFLDMPDFPLGSLTYTFTGLPAGPAFVTNCEQSTITATVAPQDGGPTRTITGPVTNVNCPAPSPRPTATGSIEALSEGDTTVQLHAARGPIGPKITSLSLGLPGGLRFSSKALVKRRTCKGAGAHRKCVTRLRAKGLYLSGASVRSLSISRGRLLVKFTHSVANASLIVQRPVLLESSGMRQAAKAHELKSLSANVRIGEANGSSTALKVKLAE